MLILAIIFGVLMFIWMGIALHLMRTIEKMNDYLRQLEKDYKQLNDIINNPQSWKKTTNYQQ
jgi:uncharacterized protein YxeA